MREKLLGNQDQLYDQDDQLARIAGYAEDTINTMNNVNQDLRNQRDQINNISDKNQYVDKKVAQTGTVVNQMTRKEF